MKPHEIVRRLIEMKQHGLSRFAVWLASLTPAEVAVDRAVNMQPAEIALMALGGGA